MCNIVHVVLKCWNAAGEDEDPTTEMDGEGWEHKNELAEMEGDWSPILPNPGNELMTLG